MQKHNICFVSLLLGGLLLASPLTAQEMQVDLDPARTTIEFTLPATLHTVHGSFKLKSGTVRFNTATGAASGEIVADAISGDTGNKGRDKKMHGEILESKRYPQITFSPKQMVGNVPTSGTAIVNMQGTFRIHGVEHAVTLTIPAQIAGENITATAEFDVPYVAWGMKDPSTFFLHVNHEVHVRISAIGRLTVVH